MKTHFTLLVLLGIIFSIETSNAQCSVDLGKDKMMCSTTASFFIANSSPSGNYTYQWGSSSYTGVYPYPTSDTIQFFDYFNTIFQGTENNTFYLTITDTISGCSATDTVNVMWIWDGTDTTLYFTDTLCAGDFVSTGLESLAGSFWGNPNWTSPLGNTNLSDSIAYDISGNYLYTDTNLCTYSEVHQVICSADSCNLEVDLGKDKMMCSTTATHFIANVSPTGNYTYQWSSSSYTGVYPYPTSDTIQFFDYFNTIFQGTENNTFYLTITDTISGCSATDTVNVMWIWDGTDTTLYFTDNLCAGEFVTTGLESLAGPFWGNPNWTSPQGNTSLSDSIAYDISGNYLYTDTNLCTYSEVHQVMCSADSCNLDVDLGKDKVLCSTLGSPYSHASVSPAGNHVYQWNSSSYTGANPYPTTDSIVYEAYISPFINSGEISNTTFTLTVIDTANNCSSSDTVEVMWMEASDTVLYFNENACPGDTIFSNRELLITGASSHWISPANNVVFDNSISYDVSGTYKYHYSDSSFCYYREFHNATCVTSVTESNNNEINISIAPNPAHNASTIGSEKRIDKITIYNLDGSRMGMFPVNNRSYKLQLDDYSKGLYFIEINIGEVSVTRKLVVE